MFSSHCCFLSCIQISQEAGQVVWYSHLFQNFPQFVVIHTVKSFGIVNKADVFLELSCFLIYPKDVGNLTSGSSATSKSSLNIWKFTVQVLLKPDLVNFEHSFASIWDECNCVVVWAFFGIAFLWDWNENWPFLVLSHCWVFQICWLIEFSTFTTSSFRIWNSSTGIPSPLLTLLIKLCLEAVTDFIFEGLQNHCRWWQQPSNWKTLTLWKKCYDQPRQHIKKQRQYFANKGLYS